MSVAWRWPGLIGGVLTLGVMAWLSSGSLDRVRTDTAWVDHTHGVLATIARLQLAVTEAASSRRGFITTSNPVEHARFESAQSQIDSELARLRDLVQDNPLQESSARAFAPLIAEWRAVQNASIAAAEGREGFVASVQNAFTDEARPKSEAIHRLAQQMATEEERLLALRQGDARASARSTRRIVLAGSLIGLVLVLAAALVSAREIGARRRVEARIQAELAERQRVAAELEVANRELEAFSYSVSHDLRAPLRAIDGFSQALIEDLGGRLDEGSRRDLERVRAGAQKLGLLIDDLLSLSRVSRQALERREIDLGEIAAEALSALAREQPDRRVAFVVGGEVSAQADEGLLRVAIQNLIGNAWKFTSKKEDARIEFGVRENGGAPEYFVRDNGAGFDMAYASKLFGAFQRLHGAQEFPGTGIGLATVARIVHRHGGAIRAEGRVGEGATFWFTLGA